MKKINSTKTIFFFAIIYCAFKINSEITMCLISGYCIGKIIFKTDEESLDLLFLLWLSIGFVVLMLLTIQYSYMYCFIGFVLGWFEENLIKIK